MVEIVKVSKFKADGREQPFNTLEDALEHEADRAISSWMEKHGVLCTDTYQVCYAIVEYKDSLYDLLESLIQKEREATLSEGVKVLEDSPPLFHAITLTFSNPNQSHKLINNIEGAKRGDETFAGMTFQMHIPSPLVPNGPIPTIILDRSSDLPLDGFPPRAEATIETGFISDTGNFNCQIKTYKGPVFLFTERVD